MAWLLLGLFFGCVGMGYFIYGKKQSAPVALLCGLALMVFPYFITSVIAVILVGAGLMVVPFVLRTA